jgi:NAD(P)-dependent dehydrogenase (short-subunit alcohol dehydrogenase family)
MSRVLITGSAQGLGLLAGRQLIAADHQVVLHARNPTRSRDTSAAAPGASAVVVGDLASIEQTRQIAEQANATGRFDAVIHNAGVFLEPQRVATADGLAHVFAVNVLAPYLLTALIDRPGRLVYLTSGMHHGGDPDLDDLQWTRRRWNPTRAYAQSKLLDVTLAFALARRWPEVPSNAVDPGWVPTRMGGPSASDDLDLGVQTQVWLATGDDSGATRTGRYLYHRFGAVEPERLEGDVGFSRSRGWDRRGGLLAPVRPRRQPARPRRQPARPHDPDRGRPRRP